MTDRCKNIIFSQLRLRTVITELKKERQGRHSGKNTTIKSLDMMFFVSYSILDFLFCIVGIQSERLEFTTTKDTKNNRKGKGSCSMET